MTYSNIRRTFAISCGFQKHSDNIRRMFYFCKHSGDQRRTYYETYLPIDQDGTVAERVVRSVMVDDTVVLAGQFMAGLTNENPAITTPVHVQYSDALPHSNTESVSFPPSVDKYRYVIIKHQFPRTNAALCMKEVKVFLRGTCTFCAAIMTSTVTITANIKILKLHLCD